MDAKATVDVPKSALEVSKHDAHQMAGRDDAKVHEHPWVGMNKTQKIHYWVLVGFRSWEVLLAFCQVIVSGTLAGAARWVGWWGYSYVNNAWLGVGVVALLFGLFTLAISIWQLLLTLMAGWRRRHQEKYNANPKRASKHAQVFMDYSVDMLLDVVLLPVWLALLIAAAAVMGPGTAALSALLMVAIGTCLGLSWKLRKLHREMSGSKRGAVAAPSAAEASV